MLEKDISNDFARSSVSARILRQEAASLMKDAGDSWVSASAARLPNGYIGGGATWEAHVKVSLFIIATVRLIEWITSHVCTFAYVPICLHVSIYLYALICRK